MLEEQMHAPGLCPMRSGLRQAGRMALEPLHRGVVLCGVDVEDKNACRGAGRHADERTGVRAPQGADGAGVAARIEKPMRTRGTLGGRARENGKPPFCELHCPGEGCARRHHAAPPKYWRLSHRPPRLQPSQTNCATCGPTPGMTVKRIPPQLQDRKTPAG